MGWIKRNLFFVIGLVIAVALLGAAGFYDFQGWSHNQNAFTKLNEIYNTIKQDNNQKPSPGNDKINNVTLARNQEKQLREWIGKARDNFQPIAPMPNAPAEQINSEMFAPALSGTVKQLQHEADADSIQLPPQYFFSFTAQSDKAVFDSTNLPSLAQQLGEVKTIVEILFDARINGLESIQRTAVSSDDMAGQQADYIPDVSVTNDLAVLTPYQITFRGFSSDIANVLGAFASSPHGFIVRTLSVQPASTAMSNAMNGERTPPGYPGQMQPPAAEMATQPITRGGLQTVLNEQLLRVTMGIEIVKLTPPNH